MSNDSGEGAQKKTVGYCNPPQHSRFKPGQSGNPRGRPKGRRNLASEIERVMAMPVPVTVNGKRKSVSTITAVIWRMREKALAGDLKALQALLALYQVHVDGQKDVASLTALLAEDAAILRQAGLANIGGEGDECE